MSEQVYQVYPVGYVRRRAGKTYVAITDRYRPALKELSGFGHVQVLWWFSAFDDELYRQVTQSDQAPYEAPLPLGMFACRSPVRPNPIGLSTARVVHVDQAQGLVEVANLDAFDDTPVLDLKPYIPVYDRVREIKMPDWAADWPQWMPAAGMGVED